MNGCGFSLIPFPAPGAPPSYAISGEIARFSGMLRVYYEISGDRGGITVPAPAEAPAKADGLWKQTCFEFFAAAKGARRYWEFNLSPAGDWNVYRFTAYRRGMREEPAFSSLPFRVTSEAGSLSLALELDLGAIVRPDHPVKIGICAVIQRMDGAAQYWALAHRGPRPDFHRRDGFLIEL